MADYINAHDHKYDDIPGQTHKHVHIPLRLLMHTEVVVGRGIYGGAMCTCGYACAHACIHKGRQVDNIEAQADRREAARVTGGHDKLDRLSINFFTRSVESRVPLQHKIKASGVYV